MKFNRIAATLAAATLGLTLAACEGPKENAMEDQGEAQAQAVNDQAEAAEDAGIMTDEQAEEATDQAEDRADQMEAQGDAMDEAQ